MRRSSRRRFRTHNRDRAAAPKLRPHSHRDRWSNQHRPDLSHRYRRRSSRPRPNRDRNHRSIDRHNQCRVLSQDKSNHPPPARLNPIRTRHSNIQFDKLRRRLSLDHSRAHTRNSQARYFRRPRDQTVEIRFTNLSACRMHITAAHER